jgi:hypothetical protein
VSFNKKSPRHRIPESFRVERLESRVLLSADPVLAPLAMAMLPHAMHVAALPHGLTDAPTSAKVTPSAYATHPLFDGDTLGLHHAMLHPAQTVSAHAAQGASVLTPAHAGISDFSTAQGATSAGSALAKVQSVSTAAASTSLAMQTGRMHIMTAAPGNITHWATNQNGPITVAGSLAIELAAAGTLTVGVPTAGSVILGSAGDDVYGTTQGQSLAIVPAAPNNVDVTFHAALPSLANSTLPTLVNLTIGTAANPVTNVTFDGVVNLSGDLTIHASGAVSFGSTLTLTNNHSLTIVGATSVTFSGAVNLIAQDGTAGALAVAATAGNFYVQSNNITFPNGTGLFSGSGTLTLLPTTPTTRGIFFANPQVGSPTGTLVIDNSAIASWGTTFTNIIIGAAATTGGHADSVNAGPITIGGTQNFGTNSLPTVTDPITFYGSTITVPVLASSSGTSYTFYGSSSVGFDAVNNITLSNTVIANSGLGNITAYSASGAITETGANTYINAAQLTATAATGITLPSTQLASLSALNTGTTGSISVNQVTQEGFGGALTVLQAWLSNAASNGNISISTASGNPSAQPSPTVGGNLTIASVASGGSGVITNGAGNISLTTVDAASALTVSDVVTAHAGTITMASPGTVTVGAAITTGGGAIGITSSTSAVDLNANVIAAGGTITTTAATDILMAAGTSVSSVSGSAGAIVFSATRNDVLGTLSAGAAIAVTAGGFISSALAESTAVSQLNLQGSASVRATLVSALGIGSRGADIQTSVSELTLSNSTSGDVFVDQTQQVNLQLGTGSGNAITLGGTTGTTSIVTTDGTITINGAVAFSTASAVTPGQTGNILIQASKAASPSADVVVNAGVSTSVGSIEIKAAGSIDVGSPATITIAAPATGQSVYLQAAVGVIFTAASQVNAGGNVWINATTGQVALGEVASSGGAVSIDAGGAIADAQSNASQTVANVTASSVRLASGSVLGIGTSSNFVEISGGGGGVTFAGVSSNAGLYVRSLSDMTVGTVNPALVEIVGPSTTPITLGDAAALTSVAVYGGSNLVLKSDSALTVATAIGLAAPVASTSTQVHLEAAGQLNLNAAIGNIGTGFASFTGAMSLLGASGVTIAPAVGITTLAGTLDVESASGSVQMGAASLLNSGSGAIRVLAAQNLGVARVLTLGSVSLGATGGSITDTNGNVDGTLGTLNVNAAALRLASGVNIGSTTDELQVRVATLAAAATAGSVYVLDTLAETIGSVSVTLQPVGLDGTLQSAVTDSGAGVATSGANGNIVLQTSSGALTLGSAVSANGSGNVLIQSRAGAVTLNAGVSSGSGNVSVLGFGDVKVGTAGSAQTVSSVGASTSDVDVESATGNVIMTAGSLLSAGDEVRIGAAQSISLASASATRVSLLATAGSITDANGNASGTAGTLNVTATGLRLNAASPSGTVGTSTDALQTQVAVVSARSGGGTYLLNDQALTIGSVGSAANQVTVSGTTTSVSDATQVGIATSSNGNIVVQTTAGSLSVVATDISVPSVNANGSGNVLLQSKVGTLDIEAKVDSSGSANGNGSGNISLWGLSGVTFGSTGVAVLDGSGTIDVESGAAVTMGAGSLLQATSGNIGVFAGTSVSLATVQTNAGVSIDASGGSITDATGNSDLALATGAENVSAGAALLQASAGIGQTTDALRTQAGVVAATAGSAGAYLLSNQSESVADVSVAVRQVARNGTSIATFTQSSQNGVTTTSGGNVVLMATAGDITLNSDANTSAAISANGGGSVLVQASMGAVNVNASVFSNAAGVGDGSGHIAVIGQNGVNLALVSSEATLSTGTGTLDIESGAGSVTMAASALVSSGTGDIRMVAGQAIQVGVVQTAGNVGLTAGTDITDGNGNTTTGNSAVVDVQAAGLRLSAGGGVGTSTDALRTRVGTVASTSSTNSGTGTGAYLINSQAITVGSVSDSVTELGLNGATFGQSDATLSGLRASNGGNLVLKATTGDATLTNLVNGLAIATVGAGNVLVQTLAGNLLVDADIQMGAGNLSLLGAAGVDLGTSNITASGTLDVESSGGSVAMSAGALLSTAAADVRLKALQNISLARIVTAGDVALTATAGSVVDANGNVDAARGVQDVQANGLRLHAGTGIGTGTDALQVQINTLSENTGSGGAYVIGDQALVVGSVSASVNQVGLNGATTAALDAAQAGLVSRSNGNLVLQAGAGDVTLTSASPAIAAIDANGGGNVLVQALAGAVNAEANVYTGDGSGTGSISVLGSTAVNIGAAGVVVTLGTGSGTVDVESGAGSVAMSAHSVLASGGADIRVVAAHDIAVGEIESGNNVTLTAAGNIADANGNANGVSGRILDVVAEGLRLNAGLGAGTSVNALQTQVSTVAASVGSGGLFLVDDQALSVASVASSVGGVAIAGSVAAVDDAAIAGATAAANGDVVLQAAAGDVTVASAINASGNANVLVQSVGGAIAVDATIADSGSGTGSISVIGAAGVGVGANVAISNTTSGGSSVDVESGNASVQMAAGSTLTGHSVRVIAAQDIGLGQVLASGSVALTATAGSITNATGAANNVTASALYLSAGRSAGTISHSLLTQVATLSAAVGSGGAFVVNDQGLSTGSVSTTIGQGGLDGNLTTVNTATASDAFSSAGPVTLEATAGDINLDSASASVAAINANGSGSVRVESDTGSINVNANVLDGSGNTAGGIRLLASQSVNIGGANGAVSIVDGAGALDIEAFNGNVAMSTASSLQASVGTVRVVGEGAVTLGVVQAAGNTLAQAVTGSLAVNANITVGAGTSPGTLTLHAAQDVVVASGVSVSDGAGAVAVMSDLGNVALAASSLLQSAGGPVNVVAAHAVTLGQVLAAANTRVQAQGGTLAVGNALTVGDGASGGSLSLLASGDIDVAAVNVSSGAGSIDVESGGSVVMNAGAVLGSATGAVRLLAAQDVDVGMVTTTGNVAITASVGSIVHAGNSLDVLANALRLSAGNGVGQSGTPLEIQAATVTAGAGAGGITLLSDQGVTVGSVAVSVNQVSATGTTSTVTDAAQAGLVTSANGNVSLQALSGDITLTPANAIADTANGSGNVLIQALATDGNVNAFAGIASATGNIDVEAGNNIVLYTPGSAAAQISTALPGLITVHAINGTVISGGTTQPGQTVNLNTDQLTLQAPLAGTSNQFNIGPATVASNPDAVVVGGPASGGTGALYLSQQQIGLIQTGFKDVDIGSAIPGQVLTFVGRDASGNASANVFVNPLTLTASGAGGTIGISGALQSTTLNIEGSRTGTTLATAAVSTSGAMVVDDNVIVTGATSLSSGTGGAANLTVNGTITGSGANNVLAMSANGGNIVVTGAVSGLDALTVTQAASLTFQSTLMVTGNVVINTTGVVNFNGGVTIAAGGSLTINGASQVTFAAGADFTHAANVAIATSVLNLDGGAGSIRGAGVLTLQGATPGAAIHVGTGTVAGALDIGAQTVSAIAPGFQQVVLGTLDTATGHASSSAGAVDITGGASLTAFAAPLCVYASAITVDAGGTGVHVGGALTLDAVGQISLGSDVTTTLSANVVVTSATSTVTMAAQTTLGSLGGNVTLTTGNSSNATLAVIDTRATGSDVGAVVTLDAGHGRIIDVNADATVNVYAAAVSMKGYGLTDTTGSNQTSVLKVRAPIVYVALPSGVVVADAGQDGRTNYNAFDDGTMVEELIAVGATTRVTSPGDAVLGGGSQAPASQGTNALDYSLMHAAAFLSRLIAPTLSSFSSHSDGVSLSLGDADAGEAVPTGYVVGSLSSHPSVSGVQTYGGGTVDYWTEALVA